MDVYLIRHTTPKVAEGICYGQSDVSLTDSFSRELKKIKSKLPRNFAHFRCYSSPLVRCTRLAAELTSKKITTDERLMELNFGDWEMKQWDEIDQQVLNRWMQDFTEVTVPGGESYYNLSKRVCGWWEDLIKHNHDNVITVTHGGVIRCLLSHMLGLPLSNSFRLKIDYGSLSAISVHKTHNEVTCINR